MTGVLDGSMALAWQFIRADAAEALLAERVLRELPSTAWVVPAIWYAELANVLLRGERAGLIQSSQTEFFLSRVLQAQIEMDPGSPRTQQARVRDLGRRHKLTAYYATYLELAMRRAAVLATFDRKLVDAARTAGVRVFGDAA